MSTGHKVCFTHLKRNCKCDSVKVPMHHSFRVPPDGKITDWKEALKWMVSVKIYESDLPVILKGTKLEGYYKKLKQQ